MAFESSGLMHLRQGAEDTILPAPSKYNWLFFSPPSDPGVATDFLMYPQNTVLLPEEQLTTSTRSLSEYGSDGSASSSDSFTSASSYPFFPAVANDPVSVALETSPPQRGTHLFKSTSPVSAPLTGTGNPLKNTARKSRSWSNPNTAAKPIYGDERKNIFLKLQKREIRNNSFNPLAEFRLGRPLPPPDDMDVQVIDSNHMAYFLKEVPLYMGCMCVFPEILNIFMQSMNQPILRHSILALSSTIQQPQSGLAALYVTRNIQHVIPQIKHAINTVQIDAAHMVSVTFLGWLSLTAGDLHTAHRHLRGLFSMLNLTNHLSLAAEPLRLPPHAPTMFLYRMAIKADNTLCYRNQAPVFPPTRFLESYHREWLNDITSGEVHIQYSLATIQLDDIANNINHLHREATRQRELRYPDVHQDMVRRLRPVRFDHGMWIYRPYLQRHLRDNDPLQPACSSNPDPGPMPTKNTFPYHSEYIIYDPMVAYMHMQHSYLSIHMNYVENGTTDDEESYKVAILVCRIFAALNGVFGNAGKTLNSCVTALWFAGLAFIHDTRGSAEYFTWVTDTLAAIDTGSTYHTARKLRDALLETQRTKCDPWKAVGDAFQKRRNSDSPSSSSVSPPATASTIC